MQMVITRMTAARASDMFIVGCLGTIGGANQAERCLIFGGVLTF
jgi:hypothetical protein